MEELAPASLRDGTSEEELQAVFGKQGLLVLTSQDAVTFSQAARARTLARSLRQRSSHLSAEPSLAFILVFLRDKGRRSAGRQRVRRRGDSHTRTPTFVQTPVVTSQRVRTEMFCARFNQLTATLVLVAHFTAVT